MKKIGILTIGQSPRPDVVGEFLRVLGSDYKIIERGALDDFSIEELRSRKVAPGERILVTKLRDGEEIKVSHDLVISNIQKGIDYLEGKTVDIILLLCTGNFPEFKSKCLVVQPSDIVRGVVKGLLRSGKLAVVVPAREQIPKGKSDAFGKDVEVYYDTASPYGSMAEFKEMAARISRANVDLVFLDCMGFTHEMKQVVKETTGKPVILSNALVARVLQEIAE
ncbi:MAG: AroM family protein [Candidatus Bathyarchaeia archaeon]|jgi:protein AroM